MKEIHKERIVKYTNYVPETKDECEYLDCEFAYGSTECYYDKRVKGGN